MMSDRTDRLTGLLVPFGVSEEEARIYLVLLEHGVLSALQISRILKMGRTKVYRLLDKLIAKGLVVNQFDEVGFKFRAEPPEKLSLLVNLKRAEVASLQDSLPKVEKVLLSRIASAGGESKVLYYRGKRGVSQVNFNMARAEGELLSMELETASAFMDQRDAEEMRRELVRNKIMTRTLTNARHLAPYTKVHEIVEKYWEIRHLSKEVFEIKAEVFVYNDVYCLYKYTDNDVFAVEIYNQDLADMQRQVFSILWERGVEMEKIGDKGEVRVRTAQSK